MRDVRSASPVAYQKMDAYAMRDVRSASLAAIQRTDAGEMRDVRSPSEDAGYAAGSWAPGM